MPNRINRRSGYRRKKRYPLLISLLTILLCAGLSLGLAAFWQKHSEPQASSQSEAESIVSSLPDEPEEVLSASSLMEEDVLSSTEESEPEPDGYDYSQPVPVSDRVKTSYFDDVLFVGDSITSGVESYALMKNAQVVAFTGINTDTIMTREVIRNESGELDTMPEAIGKVQGVSKVYVMLGANGIAWISEENFVAQYAVFLDSIRSMHPTADIYVQSILPVTAAMEEGDDRFANSKIRSYNRALQKMAEENSYYYLDVAEVFADETGCLPNEASPTDGMHFGPKYYEVWFDYIKTHVANPEHVEQSRLMPGETE